MTHSLRIARIGGTSIDVHISFLLLLIWVAFQVDLAAPVSSTLWAVVDLLLVFLFVLLHELGHVFAARRYGIPVPRVVLWPLGGFALLERQPAKPQHDLIIAAAGPLVNIALFVLANGLFLTFLSLFGIVLMMTGAFDPMGGTNPIGFVVTELLVKAVAINLVLAVLNLLPFYPLDGGRILQAVLQLTIGQRKPAAPVYRGARYSLLSANTAGPGKIANLHHQRMQTIYTCV